MINKLRNIFISISLGYPKLTISIALFFSALFCLGFKYLEQNDDMTKLLPNDMPSIITFEEIKDEFGNYEFMYVAMGIEKQNVFNKESLKIAWDLSNEFESLNSCEEVISISTMDKMYFDQSDSSIVIDDLVQKRILSNNEIKEIEI